MDNGEKPHAFARVHRKMFSAMNEAETLSSQDERAWNRRYQWENRNILRRSGEVSIIQCSATSGTKSHTNGICTSDETETPSCSNGRSIDGTSGDFSKNQRGQSGDTSVDGNNDMGRVLSSGNNRINGTDERCDGQNRGIAAAADRGTSTNESLTWSRQQYYPFDELMVGYKQGQQLFLQFPSCRHTGANRRHATREHQRPHSGRPMLHRRSTKHAIRDVPWSSVTQCFGKCYGAFASVCLRSLSNS